MRLLTADTRDMIFSLPQKLLPFRNDDLYNKGEPHVDTSRGACTCCLLLALAVTLAVTRQARGQNGRRVIETGPVESLVLPPPFATKPVASPPTIIGWPKGKTPVAPAGFEVSLFADAFDNPR